MPENRPHIILIITDQQRYDTIQALGFPHMVTPNLDRLVQEGVSFGNCFCSAPSCVPSRASLFTGTYPHTTGVYKNGDTWRHSWVELLAAAGYQCVNVGKMHTVPFDTPTGFHQRYIVENKDRHLESRTFFDEWDKALGIRGITKPSRVSYRERSDYRERLGAFEWELPEELHSDIYVGNLALWWISSYPKTEPLFLQIGFPGPHPPYDPLPRYNKLYLDKDLPIQVVSKQEMADQPLPLQSMRRHNKQVDHDAVVHLDFPSREQRHRQRAYYLANITMIDEKIGQILQALHTSGYLDRSVVIFTSDHGDCLGDHGHSHKWTMYDAVTRVPAIVWAPSLFPGGRMIEDLCQQMDLGATILDLAGLPRPDSMEAVSLVPLLRAEEGAAGREFVFAEHGRDGILQDAENMIMVRSRQWKLVWFLGEQYGQLFHLEKDPQETHDLWDDPALQNKKRELLGVLREWFIGSVYRTRGWTSEWR